MEKRYFKRSKPQDAGKDREKIGKSAKSPSISRKITETPSQPKPKWPFKITWEGFLFGFAVGALLIALALAVTDFYKNLEVKRQFEGKRVEIVKEIETWQKIVENYKDYRDGYFKLAVLEYQLKNYDKSKQYLQKALEIDPNFEKGRELEIVLNKTN